MAIVRSFEIQRKPEGRYWLTGAPRNWRQGDSWLVAHDTFHHFEGDDGSVQHEVMSFGVECWLEAPRAGLQHAVSPGTLTGTLFEEFDNGVTARRLARLLVPAPPSSALPAVPGDVVEFFRFLVHDGLTALMRDLREHHEARIPVRAQEAILGGENLARHTGWAVLGFAQGRARYRNAMAFKEAFELLQHCVKMLAPDARARFSLLQDAALVAENRAAAHCVHRLVTESMYAPGDRLRVKPTLKLAAPVNLDC